MYFSFLTVFFQCSPFLTHFCSAVQLSTAEVDYFEHRSLFAEETEQKCQTAVSQDNESLESIIKRTIKSVPREL